MEQNEHAALRNLLALKRLEMPMDTNVDRFLIEFHRRQRAQLLQPPSTWARVTAWIGERCAGLSLGSSLSYGSAFAAVALVALLSFSPQVQVSQTQSGQYKMSLHMPGNESSFAMLPSGMNTAMTPAVSRTPDISFAATRLATTRFVLAKPNLAYDANAF